MKKIEAIIRKERFSQIDEALKEIGVGGLTYFEVAGRGRARGEEMISDRGTKTYHPEYVERIKVEIIVEDEDSQRIIDAIMNNASTGSIGDGKVYVYSVDRFLDIATKKDGEEGI
jgi:nitrogen regulatory protein P-II 1